MLTAALAPVLFTSRSVEAATSHAYASPWPMADSTAASALRSSSVYCCLRKALYSSVPMRSTSLRSASVSAPSAISRSSRSALVQSRKLDQGACSSAFHSSRRLLS